LLGSSIGLGVGVGFSFGAVALFMSQVSWCPKKRGEKPNIFDNILMMPNT